MLKSRRWEYIFFSEVDQKLMGEELRQSNSRESLYSTYSRVGDWDIGDRCKVGGREGNVVFIGPTSFAPGEWIGIVFDEPVGKNDGSVDGKQYFKCEKNHGLFCKSSKLEHVLTSSIMQSPEASTSSEYVKNYGFTVGDRVVVSGGKLGTVRFLGPVDFQEGIWAGIELDTPHGKNDGSVKGRRYFTAKPMYGLFTSASKVSRISAQAQPKLKVRQTKASVLRQRTQSQESLSSLGNRPIVIASSQGQSEVIKSLQDTLKEKEKHIEQMIKEREFERGEMARMVNEFKEVAAAKAVTRVDDEEIISLKKKISDAETELLNVNIQLKERNEDIENLRFLLDEEKVLNEELKERLNDIEKLSQKKTDAEVEKVKEELTKRELLCSTLNAYFSGKEEWKEKKKLEGLVKEVEEAKVLLNEKVEELSGLRNAEKSLQDEIKRLQLLCSESQKEVDEAKKRIQSYEENLAANLFDNSLQQSSEKNLENRKNLAEAKKPGDSQDLVRKLMNLNEDLTAKLNSVEQENKELSATNTCLTKDHLDAEKKYEEVQTTLIEYKNKIIEYEEKLTKYDDKEAELKKLNDSAQKWKLEAEKLEKDKCILEEEKINLEKEAKKFCDLSRTWKGKNCDHENIALIKEINMLEEKFKKLRKFVAEELELEKAALMDDKISTEKQLENLQIDFEKTKKQLLADAAKLEHGELQIEASNETLEVLQSQLKTAQSSIERNDEKIRQLEMESGNLQNVNLKLQERLNGAQIRITNLLSLIKLFYTESSVSSESENMVKDIEDEEIFDDLVAKANESMKQWKTLEKDYCESVKEKDSLKQQLIIAKAEVNELMPQAKICEEQKKLMDTLEMEKNRLEIQLEKHLHDSESKEALHEKEKQFSEEVSVCREQINNITSELKRKEKENGELQEQLREALKSKLDLETTLAQAREKINLLEVGGKNSIESLEKQHTEVLAKHKAEREGFEGVIDKKEKQNAGLQEQFEEALKAKLDLETALSQAQEKINLLEVEGKNSIESLEKQHTEVLAKHKVEREGFEGVIDKLNKKISELETTLGTVENELKNAKQKDLKKADLEFNYEESKKMIEELNAELVGVINEKQRLKGELDNCSKTMKPIEEYEKLIQEIQFMKSENEELGHTVEKLEKDATANAGVFGVLEEEIKKLNSCITILTCENEKLKSELNSSKNELEKQLEVVKELPKIKKELEGRDSEVELLHSLVKKLELKEENQEKRSLLSEQKCKISGLPQVLSAEELATANSGSVANEKLLNEINALKERLFTLEEEKLTGEILVSKAKQRSEVFDQLNKEWEKKEGEYLIRIKELEIYSRKSETEKIRDLEQQISFLNSIIADQQKKENELLEKINILNNIPSQAVLSDLPKANTPLRLYCDVCEEFDLHNTEDCPKSLVEKQEFEKHSHFSKNNLERSYCEICEAFIHSTEECPRRVAANEGGDELS
uniref:CAP-Gly domain-containing linker protein 1 n=1 Tax=Syphacia muris TaxID=451379 RepID=A0A0N5ATI9_9BILA